MQTYLQQKIPPATFSRSVPDNCAMVSAGIQEEKKILNHSNFWSFKKE